MNKMSLSVLLILLSGFPIKEKKSVLFPPLPDRVKVVSAIVCVSILFNRTTSFSSSLLALNMPETEELVTSSLKA